SRVRRASQPCSRSFPYTTLFRSVLELVQSRLRGGVQARVARDHGAEAGADILQCFTQSLGRRALPELVGELPVRVVPAAGGEGRSEEHTSELQSRENLVCRLLLE